MLMLMMSWGYDPNWWRRNVDHEFAFWSKDLAAHVSPIHLVEWDMSLFWVLIYLLKKSIICWCDIGCQWSYATWAKKRVLNKDIPMVRVQHCFREANKCANALARRGALLGQDFVIFLEPVADVALLLDLDSAGVQFDHFVSSSISIV